MADPIGELRAAGFDESEIGAWAAEQRKTLSSAGFQDNEIDAFFVGGPVISDDQIPDALLARMQAGDAARKREGGLIQTIPRFASMVSTPEARTKLWEVLKSYPAHFVSGMVDTLKVPGDVAQGNIDLSTSDGMDQAMGLGSLVGLGRLNKLTLTGKTAGLNVATGEQIARIERGPTGEIVDVPIGDLPKSADFVAAARSLAGDDPVPAVQDKLVKLYEEHGIHPAEVAHDAATDPVTKQSMLSSSPDELPSRYLPSLAEQGAQAAAEKGDIERLASAENVPDVRSTVDEPSTNVRPPVPDFDRISNALTVDRPTPKGDIVISRTEGLGDDFTKTGIKVLSINNEPIVIADIYKTSDGVVVIQKIETLPSAVRKGYASALLHDLMDEFPNAQISTSLQTKQGKKLFKSLGSNGVILREAVPLRRSEDGKPPTPPRPPDSVALPGGGDTRKPISYKEAQQKILGKVDVGGLDQRTKITLDKLYTQAVDDLHPLKGVDEDAYQLARLTRGQFAKAQHFLEHGPFDFRTYETNGKPLKEILAPVRDDLDGVRAYLSAKRAIEIEGSGRKSGMDLAAAEKVVADGAEKYAGIAEEISAYQDQLVTYLKDAGVVSDKAFEAMREANKNYVPFFRIMGAAEHGKGRAGKSFGPGSPIKRLEGSERDIVDPLESIIKNTYLYISVAERNAVGIRLVETLKEAGNEVVTTKLPAKDAELSAFLAEHGIKSGDDLTAFVKGFSDDGETISAYRNGVKETVKVDDPELVRAFRGLDTQNLDILTRILAVPAKTLRAGAVLTPDFIARNLLRDFVGAFINSKSGLFTPIDTAKGFRSVITKDADFQNWLKSGGANATMVSLDRRYMQESLSKLTGETGLADRAWNVVKSPYQGLRMLSELAENATRLGEFKKVARGSVAKDDIQRAGFASREVTLDFARIGASMRAYNAITAFANAQIQGADRLVRAFKDHPARTSARVAGGITLPSMLLWWANHDDPRYKELPAWQRDLFWIVMTENHIFRIPKPFEAGVIFGSGVERILDKTIGQNPEAFAHFGKSMMDVLSPNFIPTGAAPMIDQFANRSTFTDRTLIPSSMEKLLPEYQYVPYTTETAKALGGLIAAFPGVREASIDDGAGVVGAAARAATTPILMENYLRAWTGGLGMYLLQIADTGLRKAGVVPDPEKPEDTLADIPFVRAFAVRYPSAGAQSIQDFYDAHARSKKFYDTYITKVKEGDIDAANAIAVAGGPGTFVRLDGMAKVLSESAHLVRMIYNNPGIKPAEKRQQIDQQYYVMITLARGGKDMIRQIERATAAQR